jgi:addiction module HigA family antidote
MTKLRLPTHRLPTHPGEMLLKEFLEPAGISRAKFARHLGISLKSLNEVIQGQRSITPDIAWLLAMALGAGPEIWTDLQSAFDLATHRPKRRIKALLKAG